MDFFQNRTRCWYLILIYFSLLVAIIGAVPIKPINHNSNHQTDLSSKQLRGHNVSEVSTRHVSDPGSINLKSLNGMAVNPVSQDQLISPKNTRRQNISTQIQKPPNGTRRQGRNEKQQTSIQIPSGADVVSHNEGILLHKSQAENNVSNGCFKSIDQDKQNKKFLDSFCEDVDDYPIDEIREALKTRSDEYKDLFNSIDTIIGPDEGLTERKMYNDESDLGLEESICRSVSRIIYPKKAKNRNNRWMYVVNDVEFTQVINAEICESDGGQCKYLDYNLPPGMQSTCKQKYAYKKLLAMTQKGERMVADVFQFPSCCSCFVKNTIESRNIFKSTQTSPMTLLADVTHLKSPSLEDSEQVPVNSNKSQAIVFENSTPDLSHPTAMIMNEHIIDQKTINASLVTVKQTSDGSTFIRFDADEPVRRQRMLN